LDNSKPSAIVYSNRHLLVSLDKDYNIRDIYYPHIGMENLEGKNIGKIL